MWDTVFDRILPVYKIFLSTTHSPFPLKKTKTKEGLVIFKFVQALLYTM